MGGVDANAARAKDEHIPTGVTGNVPELFTCENATETELGVPHALSYIKPGHPPPPKVMSREMENPSWETPGSSWDVAQTQRLTRGGAELCVHPEAALPGAAQHSLHRGKAEPGEGIASFRQTGSLLPQGTA